MERRGIKMIALYIAIAFIVGGIAGFFIQRAIKAKKFRSAEGDAAKMLEEAKTNAKETLLAAKEEAVRLKTEAEAEARQRRSELQHGERRLAQKEENLEHKLESLERREQALTLKQGEIDNVRSHVEELKNKEIQQLELISNMPTAEAKEFLLEQVENEVRDDLTRRMREVESRGKEEVEQRTQQILAGVIQRCASEVVSETTVTVVPLPSDEMKGRLIGREGRNIRALENVTGVDLIVDDTPETVTLSCFEPLRREIAKVALEKLMLNGRIHPARIEEMVKKAKAEVEANIQAEGEQTALKAGVTGLHPELVKLLGRLKYRYSFGQNMLTHSLEVSYLAAMLASEIGADVEVAKTAGLLHDIGKAVSHEVEGPHALIGANLAKRWGKSPEVVKAIAEHHGEANSFGIYGFIVSAADAISSSRPGARRESVEQYLKRVEALESIANDFPGVEKAFAIQAGREIRILVKPHEIDDLGSLRLARDIVKQIEETLEYPGQIKVTVIRETRAIDYAK
jgi:ribonuclease Y